MFAHVRHHLALHAAQVRHHLLSLRYHLVDYGRHRIDFGVTIRRFYRRDLLTKGR
jgi:hypothetical protein